MVTTTPPVTFDFPTWVGYFPEFAPLNAALGQAYFTMAMSTILANTQTNPVFLDDPSPNFQFLCYLATSHVAWLMCPKDASGNPTSDASGVISAGGAVGRISSATEGSVTVQTEWPLDGNSSAQEKYLSQTKYGVALWTALAPYRTAQYLAQPTYVLGGRFRYPFFPGRAVGPWW